MLADVLLSRQDAQAQEPCQEILQGGGHWGWWKETSWPHPVLLDGDTAPIVLKS